MGMDGERWRCFGSRDPLSLGAVEVGAGGGMVGGAGVLTGGAAGAVLGAGACCAGEHTWVAPDRAAISSAFGCATRRLFVGWTTTGESGASAAAMAAASTALRLSAVGAMGAVFVRWREGPASAASRRASPADDAETGFDGTLGATAFLGGGGAVAFAAGGAVFLAAGGAVLAGSGTVSLCPVSVTSSSMPPISRCFTDDATLRVTPGFASAAILAKAVLRLDCLTLTLRLTTLPLFAEGAPKILLAMSNAPACFAGLVWAERFVAALGAGSVWVRAGGWGWVGVGAGLGAEPALRAEAGAGALGFLRATGPRGVGDARPMGNHSGEEEGE